MSQNKMFVVFDLDGTLSDPAHRLHFLKNKDWDSFYEACDGDAPIIPMIETLKAHVKLGHRVEIWTGRREGVRTKTNGWLANNSVPLLQMKMRTEKDYRHDTMVKGEWLVEGDFPDLVYEDRNSMVEFYRSKGIPCAQVAEGNF